MHLNQKWSSMSAVVVIKLYKSLFAASIMCLGKLLFSLLLLYVCCLGDSWISVIFQIRATGWYMEPGISLIGIEFILLNMNSKLEYVPLVSALGNKL